jgi:ComF family protein
VPGLLTRGLTLLGREAAKIVLPAECIVCGDSLPWRGRIASCCGRCWSALPRIEESKCRRCALIRPGGDGEAFTCLDCHRHDDAPGWIDSWGHYRDGLERVLAAFKFERQDFLAAPLATLLADVLTGRGDVFFDSLVPVPMSRRKQRERGYNQAELLAQALSRSTAIPMRHELVKHRDNQTQSHLPKNERAANVSAVFLPRRTLDGERVLLVDDICTTAETLRACSRVLRQAGAGEVCAITIARA